MVNIYCKGREFIDDQAGWTFEPEEKVLKIHHLEANIEIMSEERK